MWKDKKINTVDSEIISPYCDTKCDQTIYKDTPKNENAKLWQVEKLHD